MNVLKQLQSLLIKAKDFSMKGVERKGQQRQRQAELIKQVPKQVKRAYDARGDALAIRRSEVTGNTDQLTDRQYEQQMKPGTKITEGGKDLYWSGTNYGWQSKGSYDQLKAKGQFRAGENTAQRINNDLGEGLTAVLGEEGTRRLGLAINKATETYNQHAPQVVKDTVSNISGGFSQANQAVSKATGIGPTITSELLTEAALLGGGQALKVGGKALKAAEPLSRVQELQRGLRGRNARPLNTAGSVGAASRPRPNSALRATANTVDDTPRPLSILERAQQRDRNLAASLREARNPSSTTPQPVTTAQTNRNTVSNAVSDTVEDRREALLTQSTNRREALSQRAAQGDVRRFGQLERGRQGQQNVVRRRESAQSNRRAANNNRVADTRLRNEAAGNNRPARLMEREYDVVVNEDRMPVSSLARNTVQSGGSNARIRAPRTQNTVDGRRVINDSENRALRQR